RTAVVTEEPGDHLERCAGEGGRAVKRVTVWTLAWILAGTLACGGASRGETAAAAATPTVKIAFIGPLTGSNTSLGLGGENSFKLALIQRNDDPTMKYHYEGVYLDDQCQPQ